MGEADQIGASEQRRLGACCLAMPEDRGDEALATGTGAGRPAEADDKRFFHHQ
jgi:hypothetical protein